MNLPAQRFYMHRFTGGIHRILERIDNLCAGEGRLVKAEGLFAAMKKGGDFN